MAEKGTGILALLGTPKGAPGGESSDPTQQAAEDAAEAFFAAGKRGDWAGAVSSYKDLKKACEALSDGAGDDEAETEDIDDEEY